MHNHALTDLASLKRFNDLLQLLHEATGMPICIMDINGDILISVGFQDICNKFHRIHPEASLCCRENTREMQRQLQKGDYVVKKCSNGLWDVAAPIFVAGQRLGALFLGQFFYEDEPADEDFFRSQALKFGFNVDEYLAALRKTPVFSRDKVKQIMTFCTNFVHMVSTLGHNSLILSQDVSRQTDIETKLRKNEAELRERVEEKTQALQRANQELLAEISERKRVEQSLRASQQRQTDIINFLPDPTFAIDQAGRVVAWNQAMEDVSGVRAKDMLGKGDYEYAVPFHGRRRPMLINMLDKDINEIDDKYLYLRKDKNRLFAHSFFPALGPEGIYLASTAGPLYDAEGNAAGAIESMRDITALKKAEAAREEHIAFLENMDRIERAIRRDSDQEKMMENILEEVLSIFRCDGSWLLHPCDPNAELWTISMSCFRPAYPIDLDGRREMPMTPHVARAFRLALDSDGPVSIGPESGQDVSRDTQERFGVLSVLIIAVHPRQGRPWLFGLHQSSHRRIWSDYDRRLLSVIARRLSDALSGALFLRDLKEKEERFRTLVDNIPGVVYRCRNDQTWTTQFVSNGVENLTGYPVSDFLEHGQRTFASLIHPHDLAETTSQVIEALADNRAFTLEYRIIRSDGEIRWVQDNGRGVRRQGREIAYLDGVVFDITEVKLARRERLKREKLQAAIETAGAACHKLNQPLQAATGRAELVLAKLPEDDPLRADLEQCRSALYMMGDITKSLQGITRFETKHYLDDIRILDLDKSAD